MIWSCPTLIQWWCRHLHGPKCICNHFIGGTEFGCVLIITNVDTKHYTVIAIFPIAWCFLLLIIQPWSREFLKVSYIFPKFTCLDSMPQTVEWEWDGITCRVIARRWLLVLGYRKPNLLSLHISTLRKQSYPATRESLELLIRLDVSLSRCETQFCTRWLPTSTEADPGFVKRERYYMCLGWPILLRGGSGKRVSHEVWKAFL